MDLPEGLERLSQPRTWVDDMPRERRSSSRPVTCLLFDEEQRKALISILSLLQGYLEADWRVETDSLALTSDATVLVNLDDPNGTALQEMLLAKGVRALGCARRPRMHATGTLHRPFRGYEMLALLKEEERRTPRRRASDGAGAATTPVASLKTDQVRRFELAKWPVEFIGWPREWWRVLAAIRTHSMSVQEIAQRCELPQADVAQCMEILLELHAVKVRFDMQALDQAMDQANTPPPPRRGVLGRIGARVVALLRKG